MNCGEYCDNCVYIGEGDFVCLLTNELVMEDFCPTENFGCCAGFRNQQRQERLEYAEKLLKENNIKYKVCNKDIAHIQAYNKDGKLFNFWARTGKIQGFEQRGIKNFIKLLKGNSNEN